MRRNTFLITDYEQKMKLKEMRVQKFELQVKHAAKLNAKELNDKNTWNEELDPVFVVNNQSMNANTEQREQCRGMYEARNGYKQGREAIKGEVV